MALICCLLEWRRHTCTHTSYSYTCMESTHRHTSTLKELTQRSIWGWGWIYRTRHLLLQWERCSDVSLMFADINSLDFFIVLYHDFLDKKKWFSCFFLSIHTQTHKIIQTRMPDLFLGYIYFDCCPFHYQHWATHTCSGSELGNYSHNCWMNVSIIWVWKSSGVANVEKFHSLLTVSHHLLLVQSWHIPFFNLVLLKATVMALVTQTLPPPCTYWGPINLYRVLW